MPRPTTGEGLGDRRAATNHRARRRSLLPAVVALALVLGCDSRISVASPSATGPSSPTVVKTPTYPAPRDQPSLTFVPSAPPRRPQFFARRSNLRLAAPRSRAVAVVLAGRIQIAGGLTTSGTTDSIEMLSPGDDRTTTVGRPALAAHDAGAVALGDVAYLFGGGQSGPTRVVQRFDASGRAALVGQLPAIRADLAAIAVGPEMIVVGGGTPSQPDDRVLATPDGRAFRIAARLRVAVRYAAVVALRDIVYVIGGATASGDSAVIQTVDLATGRTDIVGHLGLPLSHASAFVIGDTVLVAGGRSNGQVQNGLRRLDPAGANLISVGRLPYPTSDAAAVSLAGVAYLIGGEGPALLSSIVAVSGE